MHWARTRVFLKGFTVEKIVLTEKFGLIDEHWSPKIIAELNGQKVIVAKLLGEFEWHQHADEDELFWVVNGQLDIHLRDRVIRLLPGELFVVPRGTEHKPVAKEEVSVVLFEPIATCNTGETTTDRTVTELDRI